MNGLQTSSGFNYAKNIDGLQLSLANFAQQVDGAQISLLNTSGNTDGVQIGLINYANKANGAQIGLVNIVGSIDGPTIGLINIVKKNGLFAATVETQELGWVGLDIKMGSKHIYSIFSLASGTDVNFAPGLGLGVRIIFNSWLFANIEGKTIFPLTNDEKSHWKYMLHSLGLSLGLRVHKRFAITVGPVFRALSASKLDRSVASYIPKWAEIDEDSNVAVWTGIGIGLQFLN